MPLSAISSPEHSVHRRAATKTLVLRAALLVGCTAAVVVAAEVGHPAASLESDVDLGRLLRGMAVIKAGIVFAAISLLWWRLKRPVPAPLAACGLIATWAAAGASMLIWQLTAIPLAVVIFHASGLAFLVAAWLDWRTSTEARTAWPFFKGRR